MVRRDGGMASKFAAALDRILNKWVVCLEALVAAAPGS